ncbi:MAG TPA: hypothetical protein VMF63_08770 [Opitutaceae bacterium]|nr:hypothetical protein [Opitutaceae bacterium]
MANSRSLLTLRLAALAAASAIALPAADPAPPGASLPAVDAPRSPWSLEVLPRSFQKNPPVDMTVITNMTDAGRKRPPATADRPTYFLVYLTPMREEGQNEGGERPPTPAAMEQAIQRALAVNNFLPADAQHPPSLLAICHWGVSNQLPEGHGDAGNLYALTRARLVGGERFAADYRQALTQEQLDSEFGGQISLLSPLKRFTQRDYKTSTLLDRANAEFYFATVSAYDFGAFQRGQRELLWRTMMTVHVNGIAMTDAVPAVIFASAGYFGREMSEAVVLQRRALRDVRVDVGEPKVLEQPADSRPPPQSR